MLCAVKKKFKKKIAYYLGKATLKCESMGHLSGKGNF